MQRELDQLFAAILRHGDDGFPDRRIGGEAALVEVVARVVEVVDVRRGPEVERLVVFARQAQQRFVLENEIAEAVHDRLALVHLDAAQHVRAVTDEQVGAGIDHRARKRDQEVGRQEAISAAFVGVNGDDGVVRQAGGILHDRRDLVEILLERAGAHAGRRARRRNGCRDS